MNKSRLGILAIAILLVVLAMKCARNRKASHPPVIEEAEVPAIVESNAIANPSPIASPQPSPPPPAAPIIAPTPNEKANEASKEEFNPYQTDRFSLRKLDLPLPSTISELLANLTEFKDPLLPVLLPGQEGDGDGDVLTGEMRGYIEESRGFLRRIQVSRTTKGIDVAIEKARDEYLKLSNREPGLKVNNFKADPYSLVMTLEDGRVLYLKFRPHNSFADVEHRVRALSGWTIPNPPANAKEGFRTALVGDLGSRFWGPGPVEPNEGEWPSAEGIKAIMPKEPLAR